MAINKVEIEILAVGQGSCNVVKGLNTTAAADKQLEYLAILDAGGDQTKDKTTKKHTSPVKEAIEKLELYLKQRATQPIIDPATRQAAVDPKTGQPILPLTDHYADLLVISHSDEDHYTIIRDIVLARKPHVSGSGGMKAKIQAAMKKPRIYDSRRTGDPIFGDPTEIDEEGDDSFAFLGHESHTFTSGATEYTYYYRAKLPQTYEFFYMKTFTSYTIFREMISQNGSEVFRTYYTENHFELKFNKTFSGPELFFQWNTALVEVLTSGVNVTVKNTNTSSLIPPQKNEEKFYLASITPNVAFDEQLRIFSQHVDAPTWFRNAITPFYTMFANIGADIVNRYVNIPDFKRTAQQMIQELTVPAPAAENSGSRANPMPCTAKYSDAIQFGYVMDSISLDAPYTIPFLKKHAVQSAPAILLGIDMQFLKPQTATTTAKEQYFYKQAYSGTNNDDFDSFLRNLNSIITIVGKTGVGPHFIFTGDATVQNMWFNMNRSSAAIRGTGHNFITLPHHAAYRTSNGKSTNPGSTAAAQEVFPQFLEIANPDFVFISAGYKKKHGHPNRWCLHHAYSKLPDIPQPAPPVLPDNHVLFYNEKNNETKDNYAYCACERNLYGTVSHEGNAKNTYVGKLIAPSYRITLSASGAVCSMMPAPVELPKPDGTKGNLTIIPKLFPIGEGDIP